MKHLYPSKTVSLEKAYILVLGRNVVQSQYQSEKIRSPFQTICVATPKEADSWMQQHCPAVIIADYDLLAEQNFSWLRQLRSRAVYRLAPVIAVCRQSDQLDSKAALQAGVDDWCTTDASISALINRGQQLQRLKQQMALGTSINSQAPSRKDRWEGIKRLVDILAAASILIISSPLLLLIALAIKLESRGPVIYRSKRVGRNYRIFDFLKFRSMYIDAEQRLAELQHLNQYSDGQQPTFVKLKNDPRITRVGRIIRKTSLDELPQLVNVLQGDMSIVGNRPLPTYEAAQLSTDYAAERFLAPAGITGLWQVTKRGKDDMSVEERINLDIEYSKKHSFWFDLKIIFMTLPAMLQHENV